MLMNPSHSTCCSSRFCQESLYYFCLLSLDILAQNYKEARPQGTEESVMMGFSILKGQAPCSRLVPIPTSTLQPTPCWTSLLPHLTSADLYFWGAREGCIRAYLSSLEQACSVPGGHHEQRCSRTSHCTMIQYTPMPSPL